MPLGIFHQTPWLSSFKLLSNDGPHLQPKMPTHRDYFPLPMGLVEDAHQKYFWEVGIRQYGHRLQRFRYLGIGLRHDRNWEGLPLKLVGNPFRQECDEIWDCASALKDDPDMSILEAKCCKYIRNLANSTKNQANLMSASQDLDNKVKEYSNLAESSKFPGTNTLEWRTQRQDLLQKKLLATILAHLRVVEALRKAENENTTTNTASRKVLLLWNRKTEKVIKSFTDNDILFQCQQGLEKARRLIA